MAKTAETPDIPINHIVRKVKHLVIRARKLVQDSLQSDYHSVFKGQGIEFNDVRPYLPGDDIRNIDWKVTARMNEAFTRTYIEERQLTVIFAVDISGSTDFGSDRSKREIMAEIVSLLGFASFFNNDKAGLILFSDDIEKMIPPQKNQSHLFRIIRDTWYMPAQSSGTNIEHSLNKLNNILKKRAVVFLLSDFLDEGYKKGLGSLARKHDVIPIVVNDHLESQWTQDIFHSFPVLMEVQDAETGQSRSLDLNHRRQSNLGYYRDYYEKLFRSLGLDYLEIDDQVDYFRKIELLLKKRLKK